MKQPSDSNVWEDLVVSILSVNQYSLSNTYKSLESLEAVGLFDPNNLASWSVDEIEAKLKQGGCDRGTFMTGLFAARIHGLGNLLSEKGIKECKAVLAGDKKKDIENLLLPVKGIGPRVLQNYISLRNLS